VAAGWESNPSWRKELTEHKAILAAAKKGDAESASELLRKHISEFLERILGVIGDQPAGE
jgi:DNA-binding GntR family transcriptional regulator